MSQRGNYWDNAVVESFFSSLKKECIQKRIYKTLELARADVFDYIETFYNRTRRHRHLGGISPDAFERPPGLRRGFLYRTGSRPVSWTKLLRQKACQHQPNQKASHPQR